MSTTVDHLLTLDLPNAQEIWPNTMKCYYRDVENGAKKCKRGYSRFSALLNHIKSSHYTEYQVLRDKAVASTKGSIDLVEAAYDIWLDEHRKIEKLGSRFESAYISQMSNSKDPGSTAEKNQQSQPSQARVPKEVPPKRSRSTNKSQQEKETRPSRERKIGQRSSKAKRHKEDGLTPVYSEDPEEPRLAPGTERPEHYGGNAPGKDRMIGQTFRKNV
ncbi:hypothetical protein QBC40DRAFT_295876 [Triangularia verruculosa]|uniref:Uncharacterized protein n=1 Tax=Triangularia verruculosa TaxID=2587418 RepID=A0AAN6XIX9_9PEZI|nr:hypothetical protein QBC40DRAFT_295876 [Triangularia verruculosa]